MCCVQFSTVDQASETRMALDGVTWPQGNPKTLRVIFSTEEELKKYQEVNSITILKNLFQLGLFLVVNRCLEQIRFR